MLIKNKRGDMSVILITLMTVLLCTASIFIFITSSKKANAEISDVSVFSKLDEQKNIAEFYIKDAGEKAVISVYKEIIDNKEFYSSPLISNSNGDVEFKGLNSEINKNFIDKFDTIFKNNFMSYGFTEEYLKNLNEIVYDGKFSRDFNGNFFSVSMSGVEFNEQSGKINISYLPTLSAKFNLEEIGVSSFDEIYRTKEDCKTHETAELIKRCFENDLANFDAEVLEKTDSAGKKYFLVNLETKKEFFINGKFEKIKFGFVQV